MALSVRAHDSLGDVAFPDNLTEVFMETVTIKIYTTDGSLLEVESDLTDEMRFFVNLSVFVVDTGNNALMHVRPYYRRRQAGHLTVFCHQA